MEAFPLRRATSARITKHLLQDVICRYGVPQVIHTDNGKQFRGKPFRPLCKKLGIRLKYTPVYHPQSNPTERTNRDLVTKLAIFTQEQQRWDEQLEQILFSMRTADSETTKYSPAYLLYGFHPRHPIANWLEEDTSKTQQQRVAGQQLALNEAAESTLQSGLQQKKYYDEKHSDICFTEGDLVLIRTHHHSKASEGITSKLLPKWEGPYKILKSLSPVSYLIKTNQRRPVVFHIKDLKVYN